MESILDDIIWISCIRTKVCIEFHELLKNILVPKTPLDEWGLKSNLNMLPYFCVVCVWFRQWTIGLKYKYAQIVGEKHIIDSRFYINQELTSFFVSNSIHLLICFFSQHWFNDQFEFKSFARFGIFFYSAIIQPILFHLSPQKFQLMVNTWTESFVPRYGLQESRVNSLQFYANSCEKMNICKLCLLFWVLISSVVWVTNEGKFVQLIHWTYVQ